MDRPPTCEQVNTPCAVKTVFIDLPRLKTDWLNDENRLLVLQDFGSHQIEPDASCLGDNLAHPRHPLFARELQKTLRQITNQTRVEIAKTACALSGKHGPNGTVSLT
jgi:hypothetical protein